MVFLANEGTVAVVALTGALVFALAGVFALGAYVIYCDRKNRLGESELARIGDGEAAPTVVHESHADAVAPHPAAVAEAHPTVAHPDPQPQPATRPRRARPPQGH